MDKTGNYKLCQWEAQDRVLREDFNGDNQAVEAALTALAERDAALEGLIGRCGNCKLFLDTYVGDGEAKVGVAKSYTFPGEVPLLIIIVDTAGSFMLLQRGSTSAMTHNDKRPAVTWEGNTMSWVTGNSVSGTSAAAQFNTRDRVYTVLGLSPSAE